MFIVWEREGVGKDLMDVTESTFSSANCCRCVCFLNLIIQVILEGGTKVGSVTFFPLKMTIVTQKLPISTAYCGK